MEVRGKRLFLVPTLEHGFQLLKSEDEDEQARVADASSAAIAKRMGRRVVHFRKDWDRIKIPIMLTLLYRKFSDPYLAKELRRTHGRELIEGNNWHDHFWGACECAECPRGRNWLGLLLMHVRETL